MSDYHIHSRHRHLSASSEDFDFENESLDPRIQIELEKLNKASEEINRLELELDDARASFRQTLSESTQKLDVLAKKLGSCVEKARPYYDGRLRAKDAHLETQRAALRFERACSMHEAAKEMVQLAEQGYMRREQASDPAWQEMLNHATMKVNEAEKERNESELEHQRTMNKFKMAEDQVQMLQKELKRAITKSKPYFEMKARFNQVMEEHKCKVSMLEEDVTSTKSLYSTALRSLEAISDEIHRQRLERRQHQQLGVRGSGVGAECPLPPPSWDKGTLMDGRDARYSASLDPLGVVKVPIKSFSTGSANRRSRNLSGESNHGEDLSEESKHPHDVVEDKASQNAEMILVVNESSPSTRDSEMKVMSVGSGIIEAQPLSPKEIWIPGDPLGVLPPMYASKRSLTAGISHPAFAGNKLASPSRQSAPVVHPSSNVPVSSHGRALLVQRSISAGNQQEKFVPPSVIRPTAETARRESYRKAVEASQKAPEECGPPEMDIDDADRDEVYANIPAVKEKDMFGAAYKSRERSNSNPANIKEQPRSPSKDIPNRSLPPVCDAFADGRRHGSAPESSVTMGLSAGLEGEEGAASNMKQKQKLQGLILRVDPSMDPLRNFEPRPRSQTSPAIGRSAFVSACSAAVPSNSVNMVKSPPSKGVDIDSETETLTPGPTPVPSSQSLVASKPQVMTMQVSPTAPPAKSIIRSASTVSSTLSERSETEYSEIESVSATQSPTKAPRSRLLNIPAGMDSHSLEDSSDTESLASTGPMLDDEQVELLTLDFTNLNLERNKDEEIGKFASASLPVCLRRGHWSRMSLPPNLSFLEDYLNQSKRFSDEFRQTDPSSLEDNCDESPVDCDRTLQDELDELKEGDDAESVECLHKKFDASHSSLVTEKQSPGIPEQETKSEQKSENQTTEPLVSQDCIRTMHENLVLAMREDGTEDCDEIVQREQTVDNSSWVANETINVRL